MWKLKHQSPSPVRFFATTWTKVGCPDPGIEPGSPALQGDFLPAKLPGNPHVYHIKFQFLSQMI